MNSDLIPNLNTETNSNTIFYIDPNSSQIQIQTIYMNSDLNQIQIRIWAKFKSWVKCK